ncbi:MAG: ABC transporter permease subunit [Agathobacter sp.]|nr:ABC transporter permease subunit [Agathobacter sp.]
MKQLVAFIQKEFMEIVRNSKLLICGIIFALLGIMNPAIAKMTPWIMEMYSETSSSGIVFQKVEVTALTSWEQFYKNMPIGIIVFVLMFSGIVAAELQKGTLINIVTKGMSRWKIMISKFIMMLVLWTGVYFLSYVITYFYNAFYWDNSIAKNIFFSVFCLYLFGVWLISLIMLASAFADNSATVSLGVCGGFIVSYVLGIIPTIQDYMPTKLMDSLTLMVGEVKLDEFIPAIIIVLCLSFANVVLGIIFFNKKNL